MRIVIPLITLWIIVFSVGCQANPAVPVVSTQGGSVQMTPSLSTPGTSGLESLVKKATEDLAQRLSISLTQITLVEARAVVWPDASIGCPQPGMAYVQVPEDGALIVLEAEGKRYEYHNGGKRGLFLCEMIYKDSSTPPQIDLFNLTPRKPDTSSTPDNSIPPGEDQ
jgi:hypothetical protein